MQRTVSVEVRSEVVRSALVGIEGEVEDGECRGGAVVGALVTVRIELADIDLADIVVGELFQVAFDMTWSE